MNVINEAKIGIKHIIDSIALNSKLLAALPKTPIPDCEKNSDLGSALIWIEEKVVAITEAMAVNVTKPFTPPGQVHPARGIDPRLGFADRLQHLAVQVQDLLNLGSKEISDAVCFTLPSF
jgi:hypothetical protein